MQDDPGWVAVALEEYRSLRQEAMQAIDRQHQILALGTATSGVVLGVAAKAPTGSTAAAVLLVVLLPLLVSLVALLWLGEFRRMVRAGAHVAEIEAEISTRYEPEPPPLRWETELRKPKRRIASVYRAILGTVLTIGVVGSVLGQVGLAERGRWWWFGVALAFDLLLFAVTARHYVGEELAMRQAGGEDVRQARLWGAARLLRCTPAGTGEPPTS